MHEIHVEKNLYRILQGRLRFKRDGLVLFIAEPTQDMIYESYDIYEETYKLAYGQGVYIKEELIEILVNHDLWTPHDDREAEDLRKQIDEQKIKAYEVYYKPRELIGIKRYINLLEKKWEAAAQKKKSLDHVSCEGVASMTRWNWLIYNSTSFTDGTPYDWKDFSTSDIMSYYSSQAIFPETYRSIARGEPWRSMWNVGKSTSLFEKSSSELTQSQTQLCAFSRMYDNVYEHPESPAEKVIEDDICLDGWFLKQREKAEKAKKEREIDDLIQNPKIANASEVYVMAKSQEDVDGIYGINNPAAKKTVKDRQVQVEEQGHVKHVDLKDVQFDLQVQRNKEFTEGRRN